MRILAIDPGNTMSAWCELEAGKPRRFDKVANETLLQSFRRGMEAVWTPDVVAIEMIASYGMAVGKEVFDTVLWIGRFMEAWQTQGGNVRLIYRREVKLHLCHTARATDANIRAALLDHFGPGRELAVGTKKQPGPLYGIKGDEWSALAVAMTAAAARGDAGGMFHVAPPHAAQREGVPF